MVYYFAIGQDGRRYGPADVDTLVSWARDGRLVPESILVETGTESQLRADSLVALASVFEATSQNRVAVERGEDRTQLAPRRSQSHDEHDERSPPPPRPGLLPLDREFSPVGPKSRVVAGLLGIFLGMLGIHRFYLGYTGIGLLMLLITTIGGVATFACMPGSGCGFVGLWGFIEGVLCLCGAMRDAEGRELS